MTLALILDSTELHSETSAISPGLATMVGECKIAGACFLDETREPDPRHMTL
jgi:hypothetical protein